ncbi:MAG: pantetheine-phosphate adenylyltransferase [Deltaproteobacteria bacterium]|nr:pantetheine-phosphate adenylyltransferase [Deltaproteobacteria bacterium]
MNTVICPGTFDPPTNGHLNIIERAMQIFERVIVLVAGNAAKQPLLTTDERVALLCALYRDRRGIEIDRTDGLIVTYAQRRQVRTLLRGIRNMSDYEFEFQMALANKAMYPGCETLFLMTEGRYSHLSSGIIKEVIRHGGQASEMVHPLVEAALRKKLRQEG